MCDPFTEFGARFSVSDEVRHQHPAGIRIAGGGFRMDKSAMEKYAMEGENWRILIDRIWIRMH